MNELLIYGAPALTLGIGYLAAKLTTPRSDASYWEAIANGEKKQATDNWNRFVDACRECNAIEEDYQEALASNRRLTDALQARNERPERIVEAFADQKSGTAQKAVKIALGDQ